MRSIVLVCLVACGNAKAPPPCAAVGAKLVVLAQDDLANARIDDTTRRMVLDQLPAMRDSLVNTCTDTGWDPAVRQCMVDATDHAGFATCERALTATQRDALERGVPE